MKDSPITVEQGKIVELDNSKFREGEKVETIDQEKETTLPYL